MILGFEEEAWKLLVRSGRTRAVLVSYIEERICEQIDLSENEIENLLGSVKKSPWHSDSDFVYTCTRNEKLRRFKRASFLLQGG